MPETTIDTQERNALVETHTELVRYLARRMGKDLPPWMERDDLVSFGWFGLLKAAERFDPERGVKFETYATPVIRGAILDGLRALDWAPRSVRSAAREVVRGAEALGHELGREPTLAELAEHLGLAEAEILAARWEATSSHVQSLTRDDHLESWESSEPAHLPSSDLAAEAEHERLRRLVSAAVVSLPSDHRSVVALRYGEGLTLPEIGKRLGFGRGKATDLYEESCLMIREYLAVLT